MVLSLTVKTFNSTFALCKQVQFESPVKRLLIILSKQLSKLKRKKIYESSTWDQDAVRKTNMIRFTTFYLETIIQTGIAFKKIAF